MAKHRERRSHRRGPACRRLQRLVSTLGRRRRPRAAAVGRPARSRPCRGRRRICNCLACAPRTRGLIRHVGDSFWTGRRRHGGARCLRSHHAIVRQRRRGPLGGWSGLNGLWRQCWPGVPWTKELTQVERRRSPTRASSSHATLTDAQVRRADVTAGATGEELAMNASKQSRCRTPTPLPARWSQNGHERPRMRPNESTRTIVRRRRDQRFAHDAGQGDTQVDPPGRLLIRRPMWAT